MERSAEILVIDDIPANLEVVTETLFSAGYNVAAITSGERALKRLQNYTPDLILLDVKMPEIDGFEVCRRIKKNTDTANIPIIFITAFTDAESIAKGFSLGAVDYISKPIRELELLARVKNHIELNRLRQSLEQQVTARTYALESALTQLQDALIKVEEAQIRMLQSEKMATHDPLTELPNRRLLMDRLENAIALSQRQQHAIALIFLDLDGFKQVNDTHGHQIGDELLVQVTQRLKSCLRKGDGFFRLGGDEFVLLIEHMKTEHDAVELANKLLANLQHPFEIQGNEIFIGGSFGVKVNGSQSHQTVDEILHDADDAMYCAKRQRNCVFLYH